tara:strand:+ start:1116 stop:4304 length:3189 start_codon:yes stop_codon:yes gene_type:complete
MGNVIGKVFEDYVQKQIEVRQGKLGLNSLSDNDIQLINNKTSFLRLASSVNISENLADELGYKNLAGDKLAKKMMLWGGVTSLDTNDKGEISMGKLNVGLGDGGLNGAYGFGNMEFGYRPMPALEGASTSFYNNGSLQKATIKIKAFNIQQLELIETLYMKLGYTILLEWGHTKFVNNKGVITSFDDLITDPLNILFRIGLKNPFTSNLNNFDTNYPKPKDQYVVDNKEFSMFNDTNVYSQYSMYDSIRKTREEYGGNYDAFYGKITNFNWTFNPDGTYSITLTAITMGDIIESLKADKNISLPIDEEIKIEGDDKENTKEEPIIIANRDRSDIDKWLYGVKKHIDDNGSKSTYEDKIFVGESIIDIGVVNIEKINRTDVIVTNPLIIYDSPYGVLKNEDWKIIDKNSSNKKGYGNYKVLEPYIALGFKVNDVSKTSDTQYYTKFGLFLRFLEKSINLFNGDVPYLLFDWDFHTNYCLTLPEQISSDPTVCIVPSNPSPEKITIDNLSKDQKEILKDLYKNSNTKITDNTTKFIFNNSWNINTKVCGLQFKGAFAGYGGVENSYKNPYLGRLMHIHVNLEFISKTLSESTDGEGKVSLYKFLTNILNGISNSLGGINKFSVGFDSNRNSLVIKEEAPLRYGGAPGTERTKIESTKIQTFGVDTKLGGSFLKGIDFNVQIPKEMATMVSVGAQSNSNKPGENSTAFSSINRGVTDRIIQTKSTSLDGEDEDLKKEEYPDFPISTSLIKLKQLIKRIYVDRKLDKDDIKSLTTLNKTFIENKVGFLGQIQTIPPPFFIPFDLKLTMEGLSGMKIFEKLSIDEQILPKIYRPNNGRNIIDFLIKGVSHEISKNKWTTSIETLAAPSEQNTKTPQASEGEGTKGLPSGPAWDLESSTSTDSLYPGFDAEVETILQFLRKDGFQPKIISGFRNRKEQLLKVQQGVSNTDYSYHNVVMGTAEEPERASLAVDVVDERYLWGEEKNGQLVLDSEKTKGAAEFFKRLGYYSKIIGITWGGDWFTSPSPWREKFGLGWDPAHIERRKSKEGTINYRKTVFLPNKKLYKSTS